MRTMVVTVLTAALLGGCGGAAEPDVSTGNGVGAARSDASVSEGMGVTAAPVSANLSRPVAARAGGRSCEETRGAAAAARLVGVCRDVSPATRPPCNAANSCAMIEDEIARSCALFDGDGPAMAGCATPSRGMAAAADVVRRYYAAIDARDYATAWRQWGEDGPPGQPLAAFADGFARTAEARVTIGAMTPGDAGAGSTYQAVPVTVDAVLADGTRQRFRGRYMLRRVNDVDGSSAEQRRWHIDGARLMRVAG